MITLLIDEVAVSVPEGTMVLAAAQQAGIYIPHLCSHPDLPPVGELEPAEAIYRNGGRIENRKPALRYEGCQLCAVQIAGREDFPRACATEVSPGMVVTTRTPGLVEFRRDQLMSLLARHPHACLTCAQKEGCARFPCSMDVPEDERCCPLFSSCELQRLAEYIGIKKETPRYVLGNLRVAGGEPLLERDYNLCVGCTRCIRVCRDVRGVGAVDFVFDEEGRVVVGTVATTLGESACRFCTACVAVCPTGALTDKDIAPTDREALVPCRAACPAGIDVPRYVRLIGEGRLAEAVAVIREKVPFPAVLGYVCLHFCEDKCRRGELNGAIALRVLKRFAAENDNGLWRQRSGVAPPTGKRVAVVGSGPAGLTAAYYLAKRGHGVVVLEALPVAGGMMRVGIPGYRLPRGVLEKELAGIESAGVELRTDSRVESVDRLLEEGYNAVLLAVGAHQGQKLPLPGADLDGVLVGTDFLREINLDRRVAVGRRVIVLGGGNVAFDCARTALRLGADEVAIACLEPADGMLATDEEIEWGREEGVTIHNSLAFTRITGDGGQVGGVACLDVARFEFDGSGGLNVECVAGSEHILAADTVIFAVGQLPELGLVEGTGGIGVSQQGTVAVDRETMATGRAGVFAAGDAVSGAASVIEAIAAGRCAAVSIDRYLGGSGDIEETLVAAEPPAQYLGREEGFADKPRAPVPCLPAEQRRGGFQGVELGFAGEGAVAEAGRCLRCDLRLLLSAPVMAPAEKRYVEFTADNISRVAEAGGVYQLLDEAENVLYIKGAMNLRRELEGQLGASRNARYFLYEEEPLYSKRESELLQQHITRHGEMPEGNRELDDLF